MMNYLWGSDAVLLREWLMTEGDDGDSATKTNKAWNTFVLLQINLVCCHADVLMFGKNCDYFLLYCY